MLRVTWRGVRAHPVRFALSGMAVVLGVAFVFGTFALRAMIADTFESIVETSVTADAYVRAEPDPDAGAEALMGGATVMIEESLLQELADVPGLDRAVADIDGSMILIGADGTATSSGQAPGIVASADPLDPSFTLLDGEAPTQPGELALEIGAAERSGLDVGSRTTAVIGDDVVDVEIVGTVDWGSQLAGATLAFVDRGWARDLFAPDGLVSQFSLWAADGVSQDELVEQVAAALEAEDGLQVISADDLRAELQALVREAVGFIGTFLLIFASIALFVGAFIIANTFAMVVRQRMREIALLRALGASGSQVFASVVGQAAIVGLVGSVIGVAAGLGLVIALRAGLAAMGMELSGTIPVEASSVTISLALGTVVAMAASGLPAWRASQVPPIEALREHTQTSEHSLVLRGTIGGALVVIGSAGVLVATQVDEGAGTLLGVGAAAILIGALVAAPSLVPAALGALSWPAVRLAKPLGALARGNVIRNPRRTASTSGALMIGIALVGAASVIAATTQASVRSIIEEDLRSDFVLQSATFVIPAAAADAAAAVPSAQRVDRFWFSELVVDGESATVGAVPDGALTESMHVPAVEGSIAGLTGDGALAQRAIAEEYGWAVGDDITVEFASPGGGEPISLEIAAIIDSSFIGAALVIDEGAYLDLVPAQARLVNTIFATAEAGQAEELRAELAEAVSPFLVVSVMDSGEFGDSLAEQVDQVLVILYALLGLSIVIAVLGIVNTLALAIMERTREIGLMRAVGLGRLQLSTSVVMESVLIAVFGAVLGLVIGVGIAATLPEIFADQGLTDLSIPWASLTAMLVLAAVAGVLAALWPAVRATRLPVLEAISYD